MFLFVPSSLIFLHPLVNIDDVNDCQGYIAQEEKSKKKVEAWISLNHIRSERKPMVDSTDGTKKDMATDTV